MDAGVINDKLDSLMRCTARIEDWQPSNLEALQANVDQQDILTLNLTRAVQLCVDIATHITTAAGSSKPATMGESFRQLRELGVLDQYLSEQLQAASASGTLPFILIAGFPGKSSIAYHLIARISSVSSRGRSGSI